VHFEPLGIYPGKTTALADLPDGATIAIPNDTTNEARALQLLAAQGLITLPADADLTVTPKDITDNPKNLQFVEVEAAAVPVQLADVDLGVINGNYALGAGLDAAGVLAAEDTSSQAAETYANILVVKAGNESDPGVQALLAALTSAKTRDFINATYNGVVVAVF
jgi:D-methionine transport system substrate-binding protein